MPNAGEEVATRKRKRSEAEEVPPSNEHWSDLWFRLLKQGWKRVKGAGLERWRFVVPTAVEKLGVGKKPRLQLGYDYFLNPSQVVQYCKRHAVALPSSPKPAPKRATPKPTREKEPAVLPLSRPVHTRTTRLSAGPIPFPRRNSPSFALFGFNCTSSSDVVRMRALMDLYKIRVTSASEQEVTTIKNGFGPKHYSCDFKQTLLSGIDTETVVLMLDYFWLQGNWWDERYGANWISPPGTGKCKLVRAFQLCAKLMVCILPLDRDRFMEARAKQHCKQFRELAGLEMEYISWSEAQRVHPLCLATEHAKTKYLKLKGEKEAFEGHVRYVTPHADASVDSHSFVVVFRAGIEWKRLLGGFRL
ncbi:hypothetical protein BASA81_003410 [Batrachochytrium salamandrivorans]|nr:hypothetical protein BASA81_003410 [Batrachochytrium salamandrivorans]